MLTRIDEALAEAASDAILSLVAEALAAYAEGGATLGQTLDAISTCGHEAGKVRLAAGWDFFEQKVA